MKAFDFHYSPAEILENDHRYPGIWEDISTELWHRKLAEKSEEAQ